MAKRNNIDRILRDWPFDPETNNVRIVRGDDGREVLQLRVDLGILQIETTGRPDGHFPEGAETYYDYLLGLVIPLDPKAAEAFTMTEEQCQEADREFMQYYHRRMCWLHLRDYERAIRDADHTLGLMDFCRDHSPDDQWTLSHEQYRPFVLYHRTHASAMAAVDRESPEDAIRAINEGLARIKAVFEQYDADDHFEDDELVQQLEELREAIRRQFRTGRTLEERLADAIAAEEYELAARLRDELARRQR